jgi:hypothetical protein
LGFNGLESPTQNINAGARKMALFGNNLPPMAPAGLTMKQAKHVACHFREEFAPAQLLLNALAHKCMRRNVFRISNLHGITRSFAKPTLCYCTQLAHFSLPPYSRALRLDALCKIE